MNNIVIYNYGKINIEYKLMSLFLPVKKHVPIHVHDPVYSTCI